MRIAVVDVETTGLDPETDSIVEVAAVFIGGPPWRLSDGLSSLVKPNCPIGYGAMAAHHIREEDVADAPDVNSIIGMIDADFMVAHNAAFDRQFINFGGDWLCTYRLAQQVWPDAPSYSNQVLRYWLPGLFEEIGPEAMPPHRAFPDAYVTASILLRILAETKKTPAELLILSEAPILQKVCRFGKHRGLEWSKVPKSYLKWLVGQDFDPDTLHTARHYL